jgi:hypothetical protein
MFATGRTGHRLPVTLYRAEAAALAAGGAAQEGSGEDEDSTLADVARGRSSAAATWGHRVGFLLLLAVVVAGAVGVFGVHSRTALTRSNGYTLEVRYPQTARAGLDVPWRVIVHKPGGFAGPITLAVSTAYFRMFETQGFYPNADSSANDGSFVYFTFDHPHGEDFVMDYDAYIQPSAQLGKSATVRLIVGGTVEASTSIRTWLVP